MGACLSTSSKRGDRVEAIGPVEAPVPRKDADAERVGRRAAESEVPAEQKALNDDAEAVGQGRFSEREVDWRFFEVHEADPGLPRSSAAVSAVFPVLHRKSGQWLQMTVTPKSALVASPAALAAAWREREVLEAARKSKHLVNVKYAFQGASKLYTLTRHMAGGTVRELLDARGDAALPEEEARNLAAQAVMGLENLYALRVVHRDVSPRTMWLDGGGQLRLAGFGLSRRLRKADGFRTQGKAGTRGYVAPEVLAGGSYSFGADMWSFGVALFELLHGRRPFRHDREEAVPLAAFEGGDGGGGDGDDDGDGQQRLDLDVDASLSEGARALIRDALTVNPRRRLRVQDARHHAWFRGLDWSRMRSRKVSVPFQAPVRHPAPVAGSSALPREDSRADPIRAEDQASFERWAFHASDVRRRTQRTGWGEGAAAGSGVSPAPAPLVARQSSSKGVIEPAPRAVVQAAAS